MGSLLDQVEPAFLAWYVLTDLALCLRTVDDRTPDEGASLLEVRLELTLALYTDRRALSAALAEGPLGPERPSTQVWELTELAANLRLAKKSFGSERTAPEARARVTRSRTAALDSPAGASGRNSTGGSRGTSTCRSMRSSKGPEIRPR